MAPRHVITTGDLFRSEAQTIANAVNCVGVMGAGIAAAFKKNYPEMFSDYKRRCDAGEVQLGHPYVWAGADRQVLNFPTKDHWRQDSYLPAIEQGLERLVARYREWGITSLAVPALGCGHGGLDWEQVRPLMTAHLRQLDIPVSIYAPR